jgi:very-short-patch-repair endonuclease
VEALVAIDMAVHAGLTDASVLCRYAEEADARAGAGRLRLLAQLAAPAESPMETRLRWLLVQAGLPRPEVQTNLRIGTYRFRADLYYQASKLVVEYDGGNHRERMVEDNRRQNVLLNNGYQVLRFTAADVYTRPKVVVADVRAALAGRQKTLGTIAQ